MWCDENEQKHVLMFILIEEYETTTVVNQYDNKQKEQYKCNKA